jgi:hypothetical protein
MQQSIEPQINTDGKEPSLRAHNKNRREEIEPPRHEGAKAGKREKSARNRLWKPSSLLRSSVPWWLIPLRFVRASKLFLESSVFI